MKTKKSAKKIHPTTADLIGRIHLLAVNFQMSAVMSKTKTEEKVFSFAAEEVASLLTEFLDELRVDPAAPKDPERN